MDIPKAGDIAPDVALPDESGTIHRLGEQRGRWVVLYFYPEDDTPGCTKEACGFRDANEQILAENAVVWGVSPQGAQSKAAFRRKYSLPFTLLADEDRAVIEAYGCWIQRVRDGQTQWRTARRTFVIDPEGRIARVWETVTPEGHAEEVLQAIREAKSVTAR